MDSVAAVDVAGDGSGRIVRPADRLRRPAPGPVLKADGRPLPRTLEGYVWGGLTSGGWSKAVWALLFPFSLANVSSWMLPPVPPDDRAAAVLRACCRALLRLAAILLTVLLVAQLTDVTLDLLAAQCLAPGSSCLDFVPDWVRTTAGVRPAIGVLPMLIVVFVLGRVSTVNWTATDCVDRASTRKLAGMPGTSRIADPDAPALRTLHLTAALATVAVLALGGPAGPAGGGAATVGWAVAVALLLASLVLATVFGDPTGTRPGTAGRWLLAALSVGPRRVVVGLAVLVVVVVPALTPRFGSVLPGTDSTLAVVAVSLGGACLALGVLLVPAALLARPRWAALPVELRPWAGGWLAAPFMALAVLLGGGFGAGVGITVRQAVDASLALPHAYAFLTLIWGVAAVLAVLGVLVVAAVIGVRRLRGSVVPDEVASLHEGRPADQKRAASAWRLAGFERAHAHQVVLGLAGVLSVGAAVAAVPWRAGMLPPTWGQPLSAFGLAGLALLAAELLREVYAAVQAPDTARRIGALADLAAFWPRESHPVVPPCYALKVVPEVAARAAEYLADPNTRVVLTGHDQGAAIAVAAASRLLDELAPEDAARLGVVVAGAPLQWAYPRAFPGVVPYDGLLELYGDLAGRWRTMARGTDPVGGGLTTWRRQEFDGRLIGVGFRDDGTAGALSPAVAGPTGALVLGGDHWLPDPERGPFPGRRWAPGVLGHNDYYSDPEWDRAVACAAGLESPTQVRGADVFRLPGNATDSSLRNGAAG